MTDNNIMTAGTEAVSPAFAACEALFDANPHAVTDEGDSGQVMTIALAGWRVPVVRLVRHDAFMGTCYRLYPVDSDLAVLAISRYNGISGDIARELAAASVVSGDD